VVSCSNPADAHVMIQQAIASDDPIVFFEPKRRYWEKADVEVAADLASAAPLWGARVVRPGDDLTLIAYGPMVRTCLDAAAAAEQDGRSLEVVDLRSLSPFDLPTVLESVRRTRRAVVVHEASSFAGLGAEIATRLSEELYYEMEAPVLRVTGYDTPYPPSRMEEEFLPDLDRVLHTVDRSLAY
jgi:2-oxoisovalerate dehydrogenase E1 component beta subunit